MLQCNTRTCPLYHDVAGGSVENQFTPNTIFFPLIFLTQICKINTNKDMAFTLNITEITIRIHDI